jgi:hypothetical protein
MGLRRDCGVSKREHMYHPSVILSPLPIGEVRLSQHRVIHNQQQDKSSKLELAGLKLPQTPKFECSNLIASIQFFKHCSLSASP